MDKLNYISNNNHEYKQYHDYIFKKTIQKYANGVLKFLGIPYWIDNMILSEIADCGPSLHRLDFAGEALKNNEIICIILECQSRLPTDRDVKRFFQYVTSLNNLKDKKVELYILCTEYTPYKTKEHVLKDDCKYTMNVISLKHLNGKEILNNIENKIENNEKIAEEDIAALQLIVYTDYEGTPLEIIKRASKIVEKFNIDENEKEAMIYVLDVLSSNMLNEKDKSELMEETQMLNPRYEYLRNEGKKEGKQEGKLEGKLEIAKNLLKENTPLEKIIKITGLTEQEILNSK